MIGFEGRGEGWLFDVKGELRDMESAGYVLKLVTNDREYRQNVLVQVRSHETGRWIVRLDPVLQPYRTPAVKQAVAAIGARLNGGE